MFRLISFLMLLVLGVSNAQAQTQMPKVVELAKFNVSDYQGKLVYLDFWASWCTPCRASFPWVNEMQKKYTGKVHFFGVNLDVEKADAEAFLAKYPADFPIIYDPDGVLAKAYKIEGMPTAILFDSVGDIAGRHIGFREEKKALYEQAIIELLEKKYNELE